MRGILGMNTDSPAYLSTMITASITWGSKHGKKAEYDCTVLVGPSFSIA